MRAVVMNAFREPMELADLPDPACPTDGVIVETPVEQRALRAFAGNRSVGRHVAFGRGTAGAVPNDTASGAITFINDRLDFDPRGVTAPFGTRGVIYLVNQREPTAVAAVAVSGAGSLKLWATCSRAREIGSGLRALVGLASRAIQPAGVPSTTAGATRSPHGSPLLAVRAPVLGRLSPVPCPTLVWTLTCGILPQMLSTPAGPAPPGGAEVI